MAGRADRMYTLYRYVVSPRVDASADKLGITNYPATEVHSIAATIQQMCAVVYAAKAHCDRIYAAVMDVNREFIMHV